MGYGETARQDGLGAALERARAATRSEGGGSPDALSVSGAMALAKGALEGVTVRLVGEVSEVSNKPGYKAVYFTVKDQRAALPCMMWNNRFQASGVRLAVGQLVELTGRFTLYAPKGRMNFDVFSIALAGEGNLRMQVANLARKLEAEGLMAPARKRPVPAYPALVGLVTSPRGAAVHDVLRTLRRRFPLARVLVAGVAVEGSSAPAESLGRLFEARSSSLRASMSRALDRAGAEVRRCATRPLFCDAQLLYATEAQMLDLASDRLFRALPANLARDEASVARQRERLACALPASLDRSRTRLEHERERLASCGGALVPRFGQQAALAAARLHDLSPLAVLGRGYAIARTEDGAVVKSVEAAPPGTAVDVAVADGVLACRVEQARRVDTEIIDWEDAS